MTDPKIKQFWQRYLDSLPPEHPHHQASYTAWGFGDSPLMADELGQLVMRGIKRATASALWEYEHDGDLPPRAGDLSLILAGDGTPLCLIETTEIRTLPFNQVDAQFAADEGEGDGSLAYWRAAHRDFFGRVCARLGREISHSMPVICERFRVIFVAGDLPAAFTPDF